MRAFLILASLSVLVCAESPTGYSHRSSNSDLNFQHVPTVAQLHIPPSASPRSLSVSSSGGLTASGTSPIARYAVPPASLTGSSSTGPSSHSIQHHHHQHHQPTTAYSSPQAVYAAPSTQQQQQQQQVQQSQPTAYAASTSQQPSYTTAYSSPQGTYAYPQVHIQTEPQYTAPSQIQSSSQQQQQYSLPPQQVAVNYGAPPQLPPGASYGPPPLVTGAGPDHNIEYRVVYVKGPKGPSPDVVLPPPPPKQKTIVYILIPRIEKPDPILIQPPPSTPPSKPEVYFIRYKASKKSKPSLPNSVPQSEYGAPFGSASAPKPVVVEPSNRKRSTDAVSSTTAKAVTRPTTTATAATTTDSATVPTVAYGERVRKH